MGLLVEIRSRAKHVVGPVLGICAAGYFAYHMVQGDRGLIAWWNLKQRIASAQETLDEISAQRKTLQHRVSLLHPDSLDPDMLDERARVMLNYGHADEIVIFPKAEKGLAGDPKGGPRPSP